MKREYHVEISFLKNPKIKIKTTESSQGNAILEALYMLGEDEKEDVIGVRITYIGQLIK